MTSRMECVHDKCNTIVVKLEYLWERYPPKFLNYVSTQNTPKLSFLGQVNFLEKRHFWTHVTIVNLSYVVWEDVEKISKNFIVWIARY